MLFVNRELGVTHNVEKEDMRDLKLDLFLKLGSHLGLRGGARHNDTLKQAAESREESASAMRRPKPPATRDQLVVTHFGELRDLPAVRTGEWFAWVASSRWRLADQPDLVCLNLLLLHDAGKPRAADAESRAQST